MIPLDRIAELVPPSRAHLNHYHGVFAGNSPMRRFVTAYANRPIVKHHSPLRDFTAHLESQRRTPASYTWVELIKRIFETNPLECSMCHTLMRIVEFVTDPERIHSILSEMGLPTEPPFVEPAQEHPQLEFNLTRLIYDEQKDLLIELDLRVSTHSDQTADPFPDYEDSSQEPAEWHTC